MHDVVVIGGGPSGLNAARRLAEVGLDVLILDRKSEIGTNAICTGIVGKEAFQKFGLSGNSILREIKKVKIVSPYSTQITYQHPIAFANVVDRKKFDKYLADVAQSKGAKVELENHVLDVSVDNNRVQVVAKVNDRYLQKYSAQVAIIGTGIDYRLNRKLGLGYPRDFLYGIQAEFETNDFDSTNILVGNNVAPGAFAWIVPISERKVRVGLVTEAEPNLYFQNLTKKLNLHKKENPSMNFIQFRAIAQGLVSKTYTDRVITVGEAAGQVKTTSGGGIYFGLLCSELASHVVIKSFKKGLFSSKGMAEYESLWRKAIQKEILVGYYARKACGKLTDSQIEKIFQITRSDGIIPLIKERGNFDWHSSLIFALLRRMPFLSNLRDEVFRSEN